MAKKNNRYSESGGIFMLDNRTKAVMAQPSHDGIKEKVLAVREVVPSKSNNEIVLVLQYYDYSVEGAIQAFLEDGAKQALTEWHYPGNKPNNKKKKKKKQKKAKEEEEQQKEKESSPSSPPEGATSAGSSCPEVPTSGELVEAEKRPMESIVNGVEEENEIKVENKEIKVENKEIKLENKEIKVENKEIKVENKEIKVDNKEIKVENKKIVVDENNSGKAKAVVAPQINGLIAAAAPVKESFLEKSIKTEVTPTPRQEKKTEKYTPKPEKNTFKSEKNTFKSEKNTFKSEKNTFKPEKNTFKTEKNTFKTEKNTFKTEKNTPKLEKTIPKPERNVPNTETIVAKVDKAPQTETLKKDVVSPPEDVVSPPKDVVSHQEDVISPKTEVPVKTEKVVATKVVASRSTAPLSSFESFVERMSMPPPPTTHVNKRPNTLDTSNYKTLRERTSSERSTSSVSSNTAAEPRPRTKPYAGLEKTLKDLQRQTTSLQRLKLILAEEVDKSYKLMSSAFDQLRLALNEREAEVMFTMDKMKREADDTLHQRQMRATTLRQNADRAQAMNDTELAELRADIKHFVSERKVDEDLTKAAQFAGEVDSLLGNITAFGEVSPVKYSYTTRRPSASSVSSSVVSYDDLMSPLSPTSPVFSPSPSSNFASLTSFSHPLKTSSVPAVQPAQPAVTSPTETTAKHEETKAPVPTSSYNPPPPTSNPPPPSSNHPTPSPTPTPSSQDQAVTSSQGGSTDSRHRRSSDTSAERASKRRNARRRQKQNERERCDSEMSGVSTASEQSTTYTDASTMPPGGDLPLPDNKPAHKATNHAHKNPSSTHKAGSPAPNASSPSPKSSVPKTTNRGTSPMKSSNNSYYNNRYNDSYGAYGNRTPRTYSGGKNEQEQRPYSNDDQRRTGPRRPNSSYQGQGHYQGQHQGQGHQGQGHQQGQGPHQDQGHHQGPGHQGHYQGQSHPEGQGHHQGQNHKGQGYHHGQGHQQGQQGQDYYNEGQGQFQRRPRENRPRPNRPRYEERSQQKPAPAQNSPQNGNPHNEGPQNGPINGEKNHGPTDKVNPPHKSGDVKGNEAVAPLKENNKSQQKNEKSGGAEKGEQKALPQRKPKQRGVRHAQENEKSQLIVNGEVKPEINGHS